MGCIKKTARQYCVKDYTHPDTTAKDKGKEKGSVEGPAPMKRRHHPGAVAPRHIRKFRKSTHMLIGKLSFHGVVREIAQEVMQNVRLK